MNQFNQPGKSLLANDLENCIINIGPVTLGLNKTELKILHDSFDQIVKEARTSKLIIITTPTHALENSDWNLISFYSEINEYVLAYRSVRWSVNPIDMKKCIKEDVLPFLARGTMKKLMES